MSKDGMVEIFLKSIKESAQWVNNVFLLDAKILCCNSQFEGKKNFNVECWKSNVCGGSLKSRNINEKDFFLFREFLPMLSMGR